MSKEGKGDEGWRILTIVAPGFHSLYRNPFLFFKYSLTPILSLWCFNILLFYSFCERSGGDRGMRVKKWKKGRKRRLHISFDFNPHIFYICLNWIISFLSLLLILLQYFITLFSKSLVIIMMMIIFFPHYLYVYLLRNKKRE